MPEGPGVPDRVLVITAHPDDAEFLFGATVAGFADAGADVRYLICSDGSQGSTDPLASAEHVATVRQAEQRAAADVLGVRDVVFLGLPDGQLTADLVLRRAIVREVRRHRPGLVLTHYPQRVLRLPMEASHPDHVAVGEAALAAIHPAAGSPRAHPELSSEGMTPHHVDEVWLPGYQEPDHYVDATGMLDRKIKAIRCHRSQLNESEQDTGPDWVHAWMRQAGAKAGYEYAEHYTRIVL